MFFSSAGPDAGIGGRYGLLLEAARLADDEGFTCVWTPERHFHRFGGLFPNPSVVGAALAMVTRRLQIRAGSLISPLHDVLRIAEEWSVVDNLSDGRVAVSFGSGWNIDDFLFFPEHYYERQAVMYRQIDEVRALWRGERIERINSAGRTVNVEVYPRPVQPKLPVWVTSSGHPQTFDSAGRAGANLLTHLIGQDVDTLAGKIQRYRQARTESGFDRGTVTLMLHTFLGTDLDVVRERVRGPMREYLRSALTLEQIAAFSGGAISGGHRIQPHEIAPAVMEELLDLTFERYFETASLLGTAESCRERIWRLEEAGVDEIACLVDFLDDTPAVLESLSRVAELGRTVGTRGVEDARRQAVEGFIEDLD
jgi:natural product biosynthesis luciferase-like monooxygenase protein